LWIGLAVVALAALIVEPRKIFGAWQPLGVAASIALIVLGLMLRAWAGGCAGLHTRRAVIEAPRLVTGGPFAHVRNPIYLASVVLGLGMVALIGDPWLLVLYVGVFVLLYGAIVPAEEKFLREKFGADYDRYCAHVPRAFPRLRPWKDAAPAPFDPRAALGEIRLALILAGIYALLHAAAWLRG
jgi:protein-S-isoprenylcysteine O-methyltransferase Ste14